MEDSQVKVASYNNQTGELWAHDQYPALLYKMENGQRCWVSSFHTHVLAHTFEQP